MPIGPARLSGQVRATNRVILNVPVKRLCLLADSEAGVSLRLLLIGENRIRRDGPSLRVDAHHTIAVMVDAIEVSGRLASLDTERGVPAHGIADEKLGVGRQGFKVCVVQIHRMSEVRVGRRDDSGSVGGGIAHRIHDRPANLVRPVSSKTKHEPWRLLVAEIHPSVPADRHHCTAAVESGVLAGNDLRELNLSERRGSHDQSDEIDEPSLEHG